LCAAGEEVVEAFGMLVGWLADVLRKIDRADAGMRNPDGRGRRPGPAAPEESIGGGLPGEALGGER
jgi:hypothetical protein